MSEHTTPAHVLSASERVADSIVRISTAARVTTQRPSVQTVVAAIERQITDALPPEEYHVLGNTMGTLIARDAAVYFRGESPDEPIRPLGAEEFSALYDPEMPTVGLRVEDVAFPWIYAVTAQRIRATGEKICNVVLLAKPPFSNEAATRRKLFANAGWLVDGNGNTFGGVFPEAVPIDVIGSDRAIADKRGRRLARDTLHINTPEVEEVLADKTVAHTFLAEQADLPVHKSELIALLRNEPGCADTIRQIIDEHGDVVVKPSAGERGIGVCMLGPETTQDEIETRVSTSCELGTDLVVEKMVESITLQHPLTGIDLDCCIRSLVIGGRYIGAYARVAAAGKPVNVQLGAEAMSLHDAFTLAGISANDAESLAQRIEAISRDLTERLGAQIAGHDLIVSKDLEPVLIESNGQFSGGLLKIMQVGENPDTLAEAHGVTRLLTRMASTVSGSSSRRRSRRARRPYDLESTLVGYLRASHHVGKPDYTFCLPGMAALLVARFSRRDEEDFARGTLNFFTKKLTALEGDLSTRNMYEKMADAFEKGDIIAGSQALNFIVARLAHNDHEIAYVCDALPIPSAQLAVRDYQSAEVSNAAATKLYQHLLDALPDAGAAASLATMDALKGYIQHQLRVPFDARRSGFQESRVAAALSVNGVTALELEYLQPLLRELELLS